MKLPHLIGFHGPKQSGKDTAYLAFANALSIRNKDVMTIRHAFADELKNEIARAIKIPVSELNANKAFYRTILQWWGTEFRRGQDELYWIKKWKKVYEGIKEYNPSAYVFAPDCRFDNEIGLVKSLGGIVVGVSPVNKTVTQNDKHESEKPLYDLCNVIIKNDFNDIKVIVNEVHNTIESYD